MSITSFPSIVYRPNTGNLTESLTYLLKFINENLQSDSGILFFYNNSSGEIEFQIGENISEDDTKSIMKFILKDMDKIKDVEKKQYLWNDNKIHHIVLIKRDEILLNLVLINTNEELLKEDKTLNLLGDFSMGVFLTDDYFTRNKILNLLLQGKYLSFITINRNGDILEIMNSGQLPSDLSKSSPSKSISLIDIFSNLSEKKYSECLTKVFDEDKSVNIDSLQFTEKENSKRHLRLSFNPLTYKEDKVCSAIVIVEDVSYLYQIKQKIKEFKKDQELREKQFEDKLKESKLLCKIAESITSSFDIDETATEIISSLNQYFNIKNAGILLKSDDGLSLRIIKDPSIKDKYLGKKIPIGPGSITGRVAMNGKPIVLNDVSNNDDYLRINDETKSEVAVPLMVKDEIIGVLNIESPDQGAFNKDNILLLSTLSPIVSIALNNAKLFKIREENIKELERLSKIREDFISLISHELRNPITIIVGYLDILKEELSNELTDFQEKCISSSIRESHKLSNMFNQLSHLSNLERARTPLEREWLSTENIISSVTDDLSQFRDEKTIPIDVEIKKGAQIIYTDEFSIYVIIKNLLDNALKFSSIDDSVKIIARKKNTHITIEVIDSGIGIDKKYHKRIFERFFQIEPDKYEKTGGIGLGLYIVKYLVGLLNGEISVISDIDKGTTFTLRFPQPQR